MSGCSLGVEGGALLVLPPDGSAACALRKSEMKRLQAWKATPSVHSATWIITLITLKTVLPLPVCVPHRESEIKQLQAWKGTVESLLDKMCDVLTALGSPISPPASESNATDGSTAGSRAAVMGGTGKEVATVEDDDRASEGPSSSKEAAGHAGVTPSPAAGADGGSKGEAEGEGDAVLVALTASRQGPEEGVATAGHGQPDAGTDAALLTAEAAEASPHLFMQLAKLRNHFLRDVRKQLYGEAEDKQFFESFKQAGVRAFRYHQSSDLGASKQPSQQAENRMPVVLEPDIWPEADSWRVNCRRVLG